MIQVESLIYQYPNSDKPALKGLEFEIRKGEIFGFLGPSGAGKSTAQKILCKILTGFQGSVTVDGKKISDWDNSYFEKIGVGFESPNHYLKLTGKENLELFASLYSGKVKPNFSELFKLVDLYDAMNKKVETYSKGMKMRLNFIRAIQHDPDILFFDEPTTGLDPVNAQIIKKYILDLKERNKTIFVTTHNMYTADEICDRVAFIIDGKLHITETPGDLKRKYGKEAVGVLLKNGEESEFLLKDLGNNSTFIEFIKRGEVRKIHTLEATLDQVFISVTGESLKQ